MIRIDAVWLCSHPLDMRCGAERLFAIFKQRKLADVGPASCQ
jgi:hypothetical protein